MLSQSSMRPRCGMITTAHFCPTHPPFSALQSASAHTSTFGRRSVVQQPSRTRSLHLQGALTLLLYPSAPLKVEVPYLP